MRSRQHPLRYLYLLATFLVAVAGGSILAQYPQPLAAVPTDACDHGECEHTHRWWWWDKHECIANLLRVACGTDPTGEHGCMTKPCSPE